MKSIFYITILFTGILFSCTSNKDLAETAIFNNAFNVSDTTIIATLRTTGCFGKCPTYELTVKANGESTLIAKQYTDIAPGTYSSKIDSSIVNEIYTVGIRINYLSFKDIYNNPYVQDKPSIFSAMYNIETGKLKQVQRIHDFPSELLEYESVLKDIVNNSDWKFINSNNQ